VKLTKTFARGAFEGALDSWGWIGIEGKQPLFTSLFGHVFFEASDGCWWLDVERGVLERKWDQLETMEAELATADGEAEYLLAPIAQRAAEAGLTLADDEIYDFTTPPILGGDYTVENLRPTRFEVALDILGQIQEQIRDLPDGTEITEVQIVVERESDERS
jgi:hypothetical protein